eukprot:4757021-Prymnesium_polylepis.1
MYGALQAEVRARRSGAARFRVQDWHGCRGCSGICEVHRADVRWRVWRMGAERGCMHGRTIRIAVCVGLHRFARLCRCTGCGVLCWVDCCVVDPQARRRRRVVQTIPPPKSAPRASRYAERLRRAATWVRHGRLKPTGMCVPGGCRIGGWMRRICFALTNGFAAKSPKLASNTTDFGADRGSAGRC